MKLTGLLLMFITLLSNFLGLLREMVIAYLFGASKLSDAFNISMLLSEIIISWFSAILGTSFIPIYLGYIDKDKKKADLFKDTLFWLSLSIGVILILMIIGNIKFFVYRISPGFDNQQLNLVTQLAKIMLPAAVFSGVLGILTGLYHSKGEFKLPSYSGVIYNISMIISSIIASVYLGIYGLAIGYFLGNFFRFIYLFLNLHKFESIPRFRICIKHEGLKQLFYMSIPLLIAIFLSQAQAIIDRYFASLLEEGSISSLYYARKVADVPVQVIGGVLSTIVFPLMTSLIVKENYEEFKEVLNKAVRQIFLVASPVMVIFFLFSKEITIILFNYGNFNDYAVIQTSLALKYFSLSIIGNCLYMLLVKVFYANKKTYIPLIASFLSLIIYYFLVKEFIKINEHFGIAQATSLAVYMTIFILFLFLKTRDKLLGVFSGLKLLILNFFIGFFVKYIIDYIRFVTNFNYSNAINSLIDLSIGLVVYLFIYLGSLILIRDKDLEELILELMQKINAKN